MPNVDNNKNLDGIKRINKDEIKKSRKIVLDVIAEEERAAAAEEEKKKSKFKPSVLPKKIDSVSSRPKEPKPTEQKSNQDPMPKIDLVHPSDELDEEKVQELTKENSFTAPELVPAEPKPKPKPRPRLTRIEKAQLDSISTVKFKAAAPKPRPETAETKEETGREKITPVKLRRLNKKETLKKPVLGQGPDSKKDITKSPAAGKKAAGKGGRLGSVSTGLKNVKERVRDNFKNGLKYAFIYLAFLFLVFLLFYSFFAISLLRFGIDNSFSRALSRYLTVPALITKDGIVDYYKYLDIKSDTAGEDAKLDMMKTLIKSSLIARYGINATEDDKILEEINYKIVFDHDINQVGINRIRKIQDMIKENGEFVKIANKYGDDQGQVTIDLTDEDEYDFREKVSSLEVGDISGIVYQPDGYYIFRCYEKSGDTLGLSYVFIRAKNLDAYIDETISGYRIWSLVE